MPNDLSKMWLTLPDTPTYPTTNYPTTYETVTTNYPTSYDPKTTNYYNTTALPYSTTPKSTVYPPDWTGTTTISPQAKAISKFALILSFKMVSFIICYIDWITWSFWHVHQLKHFCRYDPLPFPHWWRKVWLCWGKWTEVE